MVVVAEGEPDTPVVCWAAAGQVARRKTRHAITHPKNLSGLESLFKIDMCFSLPG
jgi:hypothetical protein